MSFRTLTTEFIKRSGSKAAPASLTLSYDDFERLRKASELLGREIAVRQGGVSPYTDQALKDFANDYVGLGVHGWGTARARRQAFAEIVETLGGNEQEIRNLRGWLKQDGQGFEIPIHAPTELKRCLAICERHGLVASLGKGPGWHDFADENPIKFNDRDNSLTINFRKTYDDQTQGRVIRQFLRLLEKKRLLPDSMALAGAEKRLTRRLSVQFSSFARGMAAMAEPSGAAEGLELHSSFFIERIDSKNKTVTLRAAPEVATDFRETRFDDFIKPLTVTILENRPA